MTIALLVLESDEVIIEIVFIVPEAMTRSEKETSKGAPINKMVALFYFQERSQATIYRDNPRNR